MVISITRFDDLETLKSETWVERQARGTEVELHFDRQMRIRNYHLVNQAPLHRETLEERHYPDLVAVELPGILWQIKDGRRSGKWETVIAEDASINGCRNAINNGATAIAMWEMPDGKFYGDYINRLIPMGPISLDARNNGSGTPATKYYKRELLSLDEILDDLLTDIPF